MAPAWAGHEPPTMLARLAPFLAAALFACDADSAGATCLDSARVSSIEIRIVGFAESHGDVQHADLLFCWSSTGCDSVAITAVGDGYECRADASLGAGHQQCALDPYGALVILNELEAPLQKLAGKHTLTLQLDADQGPPVTGSATVVFQPIEGNGDGCGVTHVFGRVVVDGNLDELFTG